ncbi:MAG: glycosyltransferase family 4 protein [Cytophagales bacterium]
MLNTSWNIYNFRLNFIKALMAHGHEVHTVAPQDDYTRHLKDIGCIHHDVRMDSRGANPIKDFALIFELFRIYRKTMPEIILHYTIKPNVYGTLAAAILKIPVVNNVCGLGTIFLKETVISKFAIALYRLAFRYPKKVFFQNPDDLNLFVNRKLIKEEICDLLPGSGIDLNHFKYIDFKRNSPFTFLFVSRLITDKGILEFIEAVKKLKAKGLQARFQVLGAKDPQHKRSIDVRLVDEWVQSGTIEYLGASRDVRPFISFADCVVLPSYREGTPRTLLEASSSAKPIVTTDVPGCHHVVEHGFNGLLCKIKDADDLAAKMEQMANFDDDTLRQMGKNGRAKMEIEFDEKIVVEKYMQTIHGL